MRLRRGLAALVLAGTAIAAAPAWPQGTATYEVRRGDTLFAITLKFKYDSVSRNQMMLALWQANQKAFPGGNIHLLEVGTVLNIPSLQAVAALTSADADRQVRELLAKPPAAQVAAIKPATVAPKPPLPVPLGQEQAARRYQDGLALERKGDDQGAFKAFLESGEAGYGPAQRRLGQIYDKGNRAVQRDYQASLRWYQKAREQGVEIEKPLPRTTPTK
ncbi:MAG: FimV/HubP family polar landmark protein [Burkholderiales bacterium]